MRLVLDARRAQVCYDRIIMKSQTSALIVAKPGPLRDSLRVLLTAIPLMGTVQQADDGSTALLVGARRSPALVLLDEDLPEGKLVRTLEQIRAAWPQARCIVLADDEQEHLPALAAGADAVLLKGLLASKLFATITELLCEMEQPSVG